MSTSFLSPKSHYDYVSDTWRYIIGDNFHLGYFDSPDIGLTEATNALIDKMSSLVKITKNYHVLDVGCGIGGPAIYLHEKYGCKVTGITTSERGVEIGTESSKKKGYTSSVQFKVTDACNNKLPDNTYDIAWVMESSHLMNKPKMFNECYRVLKPGGTIVLCDVISRLQYRIAQVIFIFLLFRAVKIFGLGRVENLEYYRKGFAKAGFKNIKTYDISKETYPTMNVWRNNLINNMDKVKEVFSKNEIEAWHKALDALETAYTKNAAGYGMVKAFKQR
jgi:cyclopropane fatty-acyl-phospholipid synthase-like methyltransferase